MSFEFVIEGGKTIKLPTAGKYCDRDIIVTADAGECREPTMDDLFIKITLNDDGTYAPSYQEVMLAFNTNGTLAYFETPTDGFPVFLSGGDHKDHDAYPTALFVDTRSAMAGESYQVYRLKYDNTWTMETVGDGGGIEFLPITLTYGDNTFEPDYYTIGMALQDAMNGNGNKCPVIVNDIFGDGKPCIFCGVTTDGIMFCGLEPAENEDTGESTHLRFAYVLRPDNTFVYTMLGDLRNILYADESSFAGSDQVFKGYDYIDISTGDIKQGTYVPPQPVLQVKSVTPTTSAQEVTPDEGYDGLEKVNVDGIPDEYIVPSGTLTITENGTHDVTSYASAVVEVEGSGGDTSMEDDLVSGKLNMYYENSRVTTIGRGAFYYNDNVIGVNCPAVTTISSSAFTKCDVRTVNFPAVKSIHYEAFYGCSSLTAVDFPLLEYIDSRAFISCTALTTANLPMLSDIYSNVFGNCYKLTTVSIPNVNTIYSGAFGRCSNLTTISLPALKNLHSNAFTNCDKLQTVYLTNSSCCNLYATTAFRSTPITSSTGSIFVPASLLTAYQTATNWAYFSTQFVPIEE